jgi:hypothetical protein
MIVARNRIAVLLMPISEFYASRPAIQAAGPLAKKETAGAKPAVSQTEWHAIRF